MRETKPRLARSVTTEHGGIFADEWLAQVRSGGEMFDAFAKSGVIEWPDAGQDGTKAQERYDELATEILERTCDDLREAVVKAFLNAARDVIERERRERETEARYPHHDPAVNAILDAARAARHAEDLMPDALRSADILQHLAAPASAWGWSLVEIIMELEEREQEGQRQ